MTLDNYQYGYENGKIAGEWIKEHFDDPSDAHVMYVYVHGNEQLEQRGKGMMDAVKDIVRMLQFPMLISPEILQKPARKQCLEKCYSERS